MWTDSGPAGLEAKVPFVCLRMRVLKWFTCELVVGMKFEGRMISGNDGDLVKSLS